MSPPEDSNIRILPGNSPVAIILAIAILIGAIAKLIQVLVPVMIIKDKEKSKYSNTSKD
ncbi:MAG: hypothetical protein QNJ65_10730 [Xenococcaceae cyanobacterium MO_234.B1]|nr:hypothetical protein [Xenococcaceae cyanobacterium MO_234.B1]